MAARRKRPTLYTFHFRHVDDNRSVDWTICMADRSDENAELALQLAIKDLGNKWDWKETHSRYL